ncbi:MAG: LamG-like jellyroll fold domain-containing protein, partial [Planctomycetota bacterium]
MFRKTVITILLVIVSCTSLAWASDCNDCIQQGKQYMFDGTVSGLRHAYQIFDDCLNDPNCSNNRELKFLHAVTRTAMLVVRDDNGSIDSVFELWKQFGIDVLGNYWAAYFEPLGLELSMLLNEHDAYEIPNGAPDANEIRSIIDTSLIPEIEEIIADLNSISDFPGNRFRIFLDPNETRVFFGPYSLRPLQYDLEVDYGEVLILKGLLAALKGQLQAQSAYDMYIDANDMLMEKVYGDSFNMNADLLEPYPDLLKVLPTPNYPDANGKAILAQARQGWIDSIGYYFYTIDYIRNEEDPQEDDLLYIDPNAQLDLDTIKQFLTTFRDSLVNDTVITYPVETIKTYDINDVNGVPIGQLVLVCNFTAIEGDDGSLIFTDGNVAPSHWEVDFFVIDNGSKFWVDVENFDVGWRTGFLEGTLAADGNSFTNGTFHYIDLGWNWAALYDISGQLVSTEVVNAKLDLNPVFGSSTRYPDPVNLRDLLPEFDEWNGPQPDTVGHDLGDDATLGGIAPDMTQYDWQVEFDLQPGGLFTISPGAPIVDGNIDDWTEQQIVFEDIPGDTEDGFDVLTGSLVAHWKMNDNATNTTVVDSSGKGNDGTATRNTSELSTVGKIDGALTFNGIDDFVNIPDDPSLDMTTKLTVALWMKQPVLATDKALTAKWDYQTQGCWAFQTDNVNPDELMVFIATSLNDNGSGSNGKTTNANMAAGNWYHVAFVYDGDGAVNADRLKIYVNGEEKTVSFAGTVPSYLQDSSASVKIGEFGGTLHRYFNGYLDDLRVFNKVLSANEVAALYNKGDGTGTIPVPGVDIDKLYMTSDSNNLYGAITFYDNISSSSEYWYDLCMSYSPDSIAIGSIQLSISVSGGVASSSLWQLTITSGYPSLDPISGSEALAGMNAVEFKIPRTGIDLPGRFISLESSGWDPNSHRWDDEYNETHLKIAGLGINSLGTISGTVSYADYNDAPIFVQAYTEAWDPEDSIVASTMITAPGPYTFEGIGIGWQGYVRAFTPLFGFNIFDTEALAIEASTGPVSLTGSTLSGVNLTLSNPTLLQLGIPVDEQIDPNYEQDWYAFDAVEANMYALDLNRGTSDYAYMTLYGRDGHTELEDRSYAGRWQHINWACPRSGTYYIRVANGEYQLSGGTYQIRLAQLNSMPSGYEVWGGNTDYTSQPNSWEYFYNIDKQNYVKLGESGGQTATFSGDYNFYVIAAHQEFLLDSIRGSDGSHYPGTWYSTGNTSDWTNITGPPDGQYATVGYQDSGGTFRGFVVITNPGNWTGLTVITDFALKRDFNGDGKSDLLWRQVSTGYQVAIIMDGLTPVSDGWLGGDTDWQIVATPDFNGDGKSDLLWRQVSTGY